MKKAQIIAFIHRELKLLLSDKTTLFWIIVWPIFWIFMTAYVFVPPGAATPIRLAVGVVNYDSNETGSFIVIDLVEVLSSVTYEGERIFTVKIYSDRDTLVADLKRGKLDVGLVIPKGFSANLTWSIARLEVLVGARDPRTASVNYGVIRGFLDEFSKRVGVARANATLQHMYSYIPEESEILQNITFRKYVEEFILGIAVPINASYTDVKPEALATRESVLGWYVVGAIGMMFLYTGFSSGATLVVREKEAGTLKRILASPISPSTLVAGLILSDIVVLAISGVILFLVGVFGVGARVVFNPLNPTHWLVSLLIIAGAVMCEGIGIVLSLLAKTSRGAGGLGVILGLIFSFTAGVWLPRDMMPDPIRLLAEYFPPTWVFDAIRKIMVFDTPLSDLIVDLGKIAIALALILLTDAIMYTVRLQKYMTTF